MSSLIIVAIPHEDDKVWKVSSEKVPHLTLLYLGDSSAATDVDSIAEFLDHAASTSLNRFGLDVDRRGTLGEDQADVLFFEKGWDGKELSRFRHFLLQNDNINKAYNSVEQFDEWQPHLTLGYPESPAKPTPIDYGLSWVRFDRIALWVGDSQGPEFVLNKRDLEVSMGTEMVENVLAHYGKKGMKWGVTTKSSTPKMKSSDAKLAEKASAKARKSGVRSLTNKELQALNQRLNLEQNYSNLTKNDSNIATVRKGHSAVKEILSVGTTVTTAYALATSPVGKAVVKKLK